MIRTKRSSNSRQISGINITPLTDVMMVLLIIFMVTANVLIRRQESGFKLNLPRASVTAALPNAPLIVYLKADQMILLNGKPVMYTNLGAEIQARRNNADVDQYLVVKADKQVPYQQVITILDIARNAGVNQVGLASLPPDAGKAGETQ